MHYAYPTEVFTVSSCSSIALKKRRAEKQKTLAANYAKLLAKYQQERKDARYQLHQKRRSSARKSESKSESKA